jgi:hypothetical protein
VSDNSDAECPLCHGLYSTDKGGGKWIKCMECYINSGTKSVTNERTTFKDVKLVSYPKVITQIEGAGRECPGKYSCPKERQ